MFRGVLGRAPPPLPPTQELSNKMNAHIGAIRNLKKAVNNRSTASVLNSAQNKVNATAQNFINYFDNWVKAAIGNSLKTMATARTPEVAVGAAKTVDVLTPILQALRVNIENPTPNTIKRVQNVLNTPMWRRRYARTANANSQLRTALNYMKLKLGEINQANAELRRIRANYNSKISFVANKGDGAIISAILGYRNSSNRNRNLLTLVGKSLNHSNWNNYFRLANTRLKAGPRQGPPPPPGKNPFAAAVARLNTNALLSRQRQAQPQTGPSNNNQHRPANNNMIGTTRGYKSIGTNGNYYKVKIGNNGKWAPDPNYLDVVWRKNNGGGWIRKNNTSSAN